MRKLTATDLEEHTESPRITAFTPSLTSELFHGCRRDQSHRVACVEGMLPVVDADELDGLTKVLSESEGPLRVIQDPTMNASPEEVDYNRFSEVCRRTLDDLSTRKRDRQSLRGPVVLGSEEKRLTMLLAAVVFALAVHENEAAVFVDAFLADLNLVWILELGRLYGRNVDLLDIRA